MPVLLLILVAACDGRSGRESVLGASGIAPLGPTVTAVTPTNDAASVPNDIDVITATFSMAIVPFNGTANFIVTCAAPCANPSGTLGLDASGNLATYTPGTSLVPQTRYTVTLGDIHSLATGGALASPYVWHFTTGVPGDTTAPAVSSMTPLAGTSGVAINTLIAASFSEPMNALTVTTASFTLACPGGTPIAGAVGYAVNGSVATFSPASVLPANTTCSARIGIAVQDLAGNAMLNVNDWSFTTGSAPDIAAPTVSSTTPLAGDTGVAFNSSIAAIFSEAMNPLTITAATFSLACPSGTPITGVVGYALSGSLATLTPAQVLPAGTTCAATITTGVRDVAGNAMLIPRTWNFSTGIAADVAAPTVSSTTPFAGTSGVAINTLIAASFSEPMNPLTITTASFRLACPSGTPVTGAVGYAANGNVATFTPASVLPANTTCSAMLTSAVEDLAGNSMLSVNGWSFTTGSAPDVSAPTVSSTSPAINQSGIAINSLITATFSEPMDPLTVIATSFVLACPGGTPITGTVGYAVNGNVATFTPSSVLPASTPCAATITTAVEDVAGNAMLTANNWTFTTGSAPDVTAPMVSSTSPAPNAAGVAINTLITASFSEAMNPLSITTATFTLACPSGTPITGTVGYAVNGSVATFAPASALPASTTCAATITAAVRDIAGNTMVSANSWSFATGVAPDITAPTVSSTSPAANDSGIAINSLITATFSEPMNPLSITAATFTLACPSGTPIAGAVGYSVTGPVAIFTPAMSLPASTTCSAVITAGVRDVAGNALLVSRAWNFSTGVAPDITAPTVSSTTPFAGATGVTLNSSLAASFSEEMNPLTVNTASFTLACPSGTPVAGTVGYVVTGNVATFTPTSSLPASTTCAARVSTAVQDVAGNAMISATTWSFTTGSAPDIAAPAVSSTSPAPNASGVAINTLITATFTEPMDPLTVIAASFTLACPSGTPIGGTVGYAVSGNIATFTPTGVLPASTVCAARVTTAVKDIAGNAMLSAHNWSFSTGLAPDSTPPTVSSTSPAANDASVAINTLITASFSEAMNPLSITTSTFSLACPVGGTISGTVGYAVTGNVATFSPTNVLPAATTCVATLTTGVRDTAGNTMASVKSWSFTTGVAPDVTAPTVSSTSPGSNASGVAINTLITATFSEPMNPLTVIAASFTLACPSGTPITGTVGYAVSGNIATFTPASDLPASTICVVTITTAVKDVAGNAMLSANSWTFTTGVAPDITAPAVSSTSPAANASGIAFNTLVSASFSEPMNPLTITTASFSLACPGGTPVTGTVGYAVNGNVATFTPGSVLPASTICTATITTAVQDVAGNALLTTNSWSFTTGVAPDVTAPTVSSTSPSHNDSGVAINSLITATFSEAMNALSLTTASFTLACPGGSPISGTVGYAVSGNVATFTPAGVLPASTACTANVTTFAKDVAGNALLSANSWTFTTGVAPDITAPTASSTNPLDGAVGVCINKTINATFSEPMAPLTITTANFTLATTAGTSVAGVVAYDTLTNIATFNPNANLIGTPATNYTATIKGGPTGVKDLAGNALAADKVTTFTTNAGSCATAPPLGVAAPFGGFGGLATVTNDGTSTVINGDIGVGAAASTITGLHDSGGNDYTITPLNNGTVNGLVYATDAPPGRVPAGAVVVAQARADAFAAFTAISPGNLSGGINMADPAQCPSCGGAGGGADELAGRTLPPGIYLAATFDLGGAGRTVGDLTLDAGGDVNAIWIFQTAAGGTLNVGLTGPLTPAVPIRVLLINGADSKNVFWYVPAGATIGTGSTVAGTILANAGITFSTTGTAPLPVVTTLNGRAIALSAALTMANTVINVPAP